MKEASTPRPRPCASCPYRRDVPSGIWAEDEYNKLPDYDGGIAEQIENGRAAFGCHQADGKICSGWLAHRGDPTELLAVRLEISAGTMDPSCATYTTDVPLFSSGAEAAEHGKRDIDRPGEEATASVKKITTTRAKRGVPVEFAASRRPK